MAETSNLRAGFTGHPRDQSGVVARATEAAGTVRREAGAVVASAREHPTATSTALLAAGLAGVALGWLLASASAEQKRRHRYW